MPIKRKEEEGFKVVINIPAFVIRFMADNLLNSLYDELTTNGYPQAADLKIFILKKAIERVEEEELEKMND